MDQNETLRLLKVNARTSRKLSTFVALLALLNTLIPTASYGFSLRSVLRSTVVLAPSPIPGIPVVTTADRVVNAVTGGNSDKGAVVSSAQPIICPKQNQSNLVRDPGQVISRANLATLINDQKNLSCFAGTQNAAADKVFRDRWTNQKQANLRTIVCASGLTEQESVLLQNTMAVISSAASPNYIGVYQGDFCVKSPEEILNRFTAELKKNSQELLAYAGSTQPSGSISNQIDAVCQDLGPSNYHQCSHLVNNSNSGTPVANSTSSTGNCTYQQFRAGECTLNSPQQSGAQAADRNPASQTQDRCVGRTDCYRSNRVEP